MALNTKLAVNVTADLTKALDLANGSVPLGKVYQTVLTDGTAAGQANLVFHDQRLLGPSATENLDLSGVLTDAFGTTLAFARVKAIIFVAASALSSDPANSNNVIIGGDVTNTFFPMFGLEADSLVLRPGATFALICGQSDALGYAVTGGAADLLKVTNGGAGTDVRYQVIIVGANA